jgi:hypothetical protein
MGEIAVNQNSTIVLPVPLDLFKPFLETGDGYGERSKPPREKREEEKEAERIYEQTVEKGTDG